MNYLSESEAIKIGECASYMESSTFLLYLDFRKFEDSLSEYKDKDQIIASSASRISQILGHLKFVRSEGDISVLVQTKNILYLYNNYPSSSMIKDSKFDLINEPLMSNNGICIKNTNEFIKQTIKRVSSHREVCRWQGEMLGTPKAFTPEMEREQKQGKGW